MNYFMDFYKNFHSIFFLKLLHILLFLPASFFIKALFANMATSDSQFKQPSAARVSVFIIVNRLLFQTDLQIADCCAILISFKIVLVFNTTSADLVLMSADVVLKSTTILKEMRILQLSS